ncbi:MAG: hypothetical protein K2L25_03175 [Alphaproteobacteria bacterium]|nr:hypothetical protein [Alphaproteobacteria bacterium]
MKNTFLVSFAVYSAFVAGAVAGGGNNVSQYIGDWGGGKWAVCGQHTLNSNNACIGATSTCANRAMFARNYTDEWAVQMLVAMKVTANGAQFCPVQVEGKNKNKGNAWTEYAAAGSNCVWLCKAGFSGDGCTTELSAVSSCDPTPLKASNYSSIGRIASGANIEDSVAMFAFNNYNGCGVHKGQEHDIILGVTRWTPSGHGAFVQQLIVRAERSGWKHMDSWATIYPAAGATEILVCKNGYKPNAAGTDCDEINMNVCAQAQACSGWSNAGFDEKQHVMVQASGQTCYEFRCAQQGYAFQSAADRTCVECSSSLRDGAHPVSGLCVKCEIGKIFNRETGECADADAFNKSDMQYGKGKNKSAQSDITKQCWTFSIPEEYTVCVKTGGGQTSPSSDSGSVSRAARQPIRR